MNVSPETLAYGEPYLQVYFGGHRFPLGQPGRHRPFSRRGRREDSAESGAGREPAPRRAELLVHLRGGAAPRLRSAGSGPGNRGRPGYRGVGLAGTSAAEAPGRSSHSGTAHWWPSSGRGLDWPLIVRMLRDRRCPWPWPHPVATAPGWSSWRSWVPRRWPRVCKRPWGWACRSRQLGIVAALAFQIATATLVGQAIGRGNPARPRLGRRSVQLLAPHGGRGRPPRHPGGAFGGAFPSTTGSRRPGGPRSCAGLPWLSYSAPSTSACKAPSWGPAIRAGLSLYLDQRVGPDVGAGLPFLLTGAGCPRACWPPGRWPRCLRFYSCAAAVAGR